MRHPLLDEHALLDSPRASIDDAVVGGAGRWRVAHAELDEAGVALVLDVRPQALEHGRPTEGLHGSGGVLRRVHDGARWRRDVVGRQQQLGVAFVESDPAGGQGVQDRTSSRGSAGGILPRRERSDAIGLFTVRCAGAQAASRSCLHTLVWPKTSSRRSRRPGPVAQQSLPERHRAATSPNLRNGRQPRCRRWVYTLLLVRSPRSDTSSFPVTPAAGSACGRPSAAA